MHRVAIRVVPAVVLTAALGVLAVPTTHISSNFSRCSNLEMTWLEQR